MDKRGQEDVPVLSAYGVVKTIIAVVLVLIVLGIVAVSCGFITVFTLDSGTERTFEGVVKLVNKISQEDYKDKREDHPSVFIGNNVAFVGFDMNQNSITIDNKIVNRPFECGEPTQKSCLAVCALNDIRESSCSGKSLLKSSVFDVNLRPSDNSKEHILIKGEIKSGTISVENKDGIVYISLKS